MVNYAHYLYFGVLPNTFSINFLITNTTYTISLIKDSFNIVHLIILLCLILFFMIFLELYHKKIAPPKNKKGIVVTSFFFILLFFVINNNLKMNSKPFTNLSTTLFNFIYYTREYFGETIKLKRKMFTNRLPDIKEEEKTPAKINFLLFVSESVRDGSTYPKKIYKKINPFVNKLELENKILRFKNYYANSNSTLNCFYSITSGDMKKSNPKSILYYDYLKAYKDIKTFYITSQSTHMSYLNKFYRKNLDNLVSRESFDFEEFNDRGINDFEVVNYFESYIDTLSSNFAGIIQFNNTHYPYRISNKQNKIIKESNFEFENYLNTIYEQDIVIKKYFQILKKNNLLDSTIIIFISDHGEAFGEHNSSGHLSSLFNEQTKVPFWIYVPEKMKDLRLNTKLNQNIYSSHLDILPTVMDIFDISSDKIKTLPEGYSILKPLPPNRIIPMKGEDMVPCYGYIYNNFKYINTGKTQGNKILAFNLLKDPEEKNNLFFTFSSVEQRKIKNTLDSLKTAYHIK